MLSQVIANVLSSTSSLPFPHLPTSSSLSQRLPTKNPPIVVKSLDSQSSSPPRSLPVLPESSSPEVLLLPAATSASCLAAVMPASIPCPSSPCRPACLLASISSILSSSASPRSRFLRPMLAALASPLPLPFKSSVQSSPFLSHFVPIIPVVVFCKRNASSTSHCRPCNLIRHPRPPCSCNCRCLVKPCHNCPMLFDIPLYTLTISINLALLVVFASVYRRYSGDVMKVSRIQHLRPSSSMSSTAYSCHLNASPTAS